VGIVFAIVFVKELFGGTGRNLFNPALGGRCFIYLVFYEHLTGPVWPMPYRGGVGGFAHWLWRGAEQGIDALTAATAASAWKVSPLSGPEFSLGEMVMGVIPGSIGESQKIFIVGAALFLIGVKVADWRLVISPIIGAVGMSAILHFLTAGWAPPPHMALFGGSLLFGATFMITDPVSAPVMAPSKWVYGIAIGITTILIRVYAPFPQGLMFGILLLNPFSRLLDYFFRTLRYRKSRG
jgi:Na+-transporting NADH:ubiquinone oxidoreductase subunit B